MESNPNPNIRVSQNAGLIDTLAAAGRYALVIIGAVPLLLQLLGDQDFVGFVNYFRSADGASLVTAATAFVTLAYGLYKTHKRGDQIATVALDSRVPPQVAAKK